MKRRNSLTTSCEDSYSTPAVSKAVDLETYWFYRPQHKDYQLHFLQRAEKTENQRPPIPTTEAERLWFYRGYTNSLQKLQIIYLQQFDYSSFFWLYTFNVLFRSFPTYYLHVFLAAYSPSYHLFGQKMVPILVGVGWQVLLCALFQLVGAADNLALLLIYAVKGFIMQSPWNRCAATYNEISPNFKRYRCYAIDDFLNITKHKKFHVPLQPEQDDYLFFTHNFYRFGVNGSSAGQEPFTGAPLAYFLEHFITLNVLEYKAYYMIGIYGVIWISAGMFYEQLYKKYIWTVLKYGQLIVWLIFLGSFLLMLYDMIEYDIQSIQRTSHPETQALGLGWDMDMHAGSITGPPIVHLLTARSSQPINPGRDSTVIIASDVLVYLFNGLVNYTLKTYIEATTTGTVPILVSWLNPRPMFYFWPFFFHELTFGTLISRIFYACNFVAEFTVFVVTYQIVIEVIVCEWQWVRRWLATVLFSAIGLTINFFFSYPVKINLYLFGTAITSLTEVVIVCWLYPIGRLFDDIHFHCGSPPILLRKWSLSILPFYHIYKLYTMFKTFLKWSADPSQDQEDRYLAAGDKSSYKWTWIVPVVPLLLGIVYSILEYRIIKKQVWKSLIIPMPKFGPQDHITRQLRKRFDSRRYIGSQAERSLGRHLSSKAHTPIYKLDICYGPPRTSIIHPAVVGEKRNRHSTKRFKQVVR